MYILGCHRLQITNNNIVYLALVIGFLSAIIEDPDEMPHYHLVFSDSQSTHLGVISVENT